MAWWRRRRERRAAERAGADTGVGAGTGAGGAPEPGSGPASDSDSGRTGLASLNHQTGRTGRSGVPGQSGDIGGASTSSPTGRSDVPDPTDESDVPGTSAAADVIPWRDLDGGVYVRLLGPLAADPDVGRLLDRCERDNLAPHDRAFVDGIPHRAPGRTDPSAVRAEGAPRDPDRGLARALPGAPGHRPPGPDPAVGAAPRRRRLADRAPPTGREALVVDHPRSRTPGPEDVDVLRVLLPRRLSAEDAKAWSRFLGQAKIRPALPQLELS